MSPVRSKSDETNESVPKYLCELTNHLSCVNSVRWSLDGKWLASGGDDAIIMIWQIRHQGAMAGGNTGFGKETHEQWSCVHMLRGHGSDILDLSWSSDQKFLASCSVDNSIIIWNAKELPQKVTVISGHQGLVKGITWDPVGKYMASQSDDRSIRIWRVSDWKEVKSVTEPFKRCGGTTHVLRLSWSPDGKYIVSAHALNNDGPTAQIIERGVEWKTGMDFVGHRKAIEVVLFNPHLFVNSGSKENHGCVALGSRDRSLSVWLTNLKRPLLVMHDLFKDSILDLSWSTDGYELLVCSTDGSVAYLSFSKKELGLRLSKQAFDDLYIQTYGFKRTELESKAPGMVLIENPEMLKLHSTSDGGIPTISSASSLSIKPPNPGQETSGGKSMATGSTSAKSSLAVTQQVETITKDGKRRITPITLNTEPSSILGAPLPFTSFSPKQNKGTVLQTSPEIDLSKKSSSSSEHSTPKSATAEILESDGTSLKPISFEPLSPQNDAKHRQSSPFRKSVAVVSKTGQKRDLEAESNTDISLPKAKKSKKKGMQMVVVSSSVVQQKASTPQKQSSLMLKQTAVVHFPAPKLESNITISLLNMDGTEDIPTIEINNEPSPMSQFSLAYAKGSETIWKVSFSSPCLRATANQHITCITCQDKSMSIYSTLTGRLIVGKLYQMENVLDLKAEDHFLMVMTCSGHVSIWDTRKMRAILKDCSFHSLLQDPKLPPEEYFLTKNGLPVLRIKSNSFIYNIDMECWMELGNSREISEIKTLYFSLSESPSKDTLPLNHLQKYLTGSNERSDYVGLMLHDIRTSTSTQSCTLTYLESQISRCLCLKSPLEYRHWCKAYVQFLVKDNLEGRLREFCRGFCAPTGRNEIILGFRKEELLQEFLAVVSKNPKFQRFYLELREVLDGVQRTVIS